MWYIYVNVDCYILCMCVCYIVTYAYIYVYVYSIRYDKHMDCKTFLPKLYDISYNSTV